MRDEGDRNIEFAVWFWASLLAALFLAITCHAQALVFATPALTRIVPGLVPYNPSVPSTYTLQTAKDNALAFYNAIEECRTDHKNLAVVADWYAVADHNGDGIDIKIDGFEGFQFTSTGGITERRWPADQTVGSNTAAVLMHIPDADITNDIVIQQSDSRYCFIGPITVIGARVTDTTTADAAFNGGQMAKTGLLVLNDDATPDGKSEYFYSAVLCQEAARASTSGAGTDGANDLTFRMLHTRYVNRGFKVDAVGEQANDHVFHRVSHSGSPIADSYIEINGGGHVHILNAYGTPGLFMRVNSSAGSGTQNYLIDDIHYDPNALIAGQRVFELLGNSASEVRVRIGGLMQDQGLVRQQIHDLQFGVTANSTSARNIVYDLRGGGVEREAYPTRPAFGWELPLNPARVSTTPATAPITNTRLMIEAATGADVASRWTTTYDSGTAELRATTVNDVSSAANHLTQSPGLTCPVVNRGNINHRPLLAMMQRPAGANQYRWMQDTTPADLDSAVGDITVMAVFVADERLSEDAGESYIVSCEQPHATDPVLGWALGLNASEQPFFEVQGVRATLTAFPIDEAREWKRYCIIGRRRASDGQTTVTVGDLTSAAADGPDGTLTTVTGPLIIGARWDGDSAEDGFEGYFGPIHVDLQELFTVNGSVPTGPLDATADGLRRLNYFRSGWGVW